jgi:hypothetical protein
MPISFRIDHEKRIVVARGYGVFGPNDPFDYQRDAWSGADVVGYDELIDMTHVADIALPSGQRIKDLASVAARMDGPSARSKFAIVAPGDLAFGLGRMFQVYREGQKGSTKEVGVFRTMKEALAFLERTEPPSLPPLPPGFAATTE